MPMLPVSALMGFVPMIAASNFLFLGAGIGLPVQLAPERQQGVRVELSLSVPAFALLYQIDWLRAGNDAKADKRTGVMLQLSL